MISLQDVDVVFGPKPSVVFPLLDQGLDQDEILKKTNHFVAVSKANLHVDRGEIFVLMGLSGSGKSSLLRCINGLNPVSRGQVILEKSRHKNISKASTEALRQIRMEHISMVFQKFGLLPWRTLFDNVGLGLELKGLSREEREPLIQKNLETVGLSKWASHYPHQLSGGMQQRVGLARALATQADILLMDEPFSALDPLIRSQLQNELLKLQKELKKTIVFVSHDMDEAFKIANRIGIMQAGKIVQIGKPADIMQHPVNDYVRSFTAHMKNTCPTCQKNAELLAC